MPKATSAVWSLFVHGKTRDVHHLQQSRTIERLDAPEPSNSTKFPVLDGKFVSAFFKLKLGLKMPNKTSKFVFRRKTHEPAEELAPYPELARLLFC